MSKRSAHAFYQRLSRDEEFLTALLAADGRNDRLAVAKAAGYDFDQGELEDATVAFVKERESVANTRLDSGPDAEAFGTEKVSRLGMSLIDLVLIRVSGDYGDVCFFEEAGQFRL